MADDGGSCFQAAKSPLPARKADGEGSEEREKQRRMEEKGMVVGMIWRMPADSKLPILRPRYLKIRCLDQHLSSLLEEAQDHQIIF